MINQMQFSLLENILTVLFLIAVVLWICYLCLQRRSKGAFCTQTMEKAVVLSKNTNTDTSQTVYLQNTNATTGLVQAETVNQIIFQDVDHPEKCVTLEVDDTIFSTLKEGEQGKLTFRDRRLLSFGALQSQNHKDYKFKGIS